MIKRILFIAGILLLSASLVGCGLGNRGKFADIRNINTALGDNLICFGDSLTAGDGAAKSDDYPTVLQKRLGLTVINAGRSGDTTDNAISRLDKVLEQSPKVVIVEFGANDYFVAFQHTSSEAEIDYQKTFQNLKIIVSKIQNVGGVVVIAGLPLNSEFQKGYKKLAKETGSVLIPNILDGIYGNQQLMSADNRHPNAAGYQRMADTFLKVVEPLLEEMGK